MTKPIASRPDWQYARRPPPLPADAVHVWRVDLARRADDGAGSVLCAAERERAARFARDGDRARFVATRSALRGLLAAYLDVAAQAIELGTGAHGKPGVAAPPGAIRFNLSHSGDCALIAIARGREVGVDVERIRPLGELDTLIARYASPAERAVLAACPEDDRLRAFFDLWTLKEAYLKGCGDGLLRDLAGIEVALGSAPMRLAAVHDRPEDRARWRLEPLDAGEGYAAALAVEGEHARLALLSRAAAERS